MAKAGETLGDPLELNNIHDGDSIKCKCYANLEAKKKKKKQQHIPDSINSIYLVKL